MRTKSPSWLPKRVYPHGRKYWFYPLGKKPIPLGPIDDPGACLSAYAKLVAPSTERPRTIGDGLDRYLRDVLIAKKPRTQTTYKQFIAKLREGLGHMDAREVTLDDLYAYHEARKAPVRANREISFLGQLYRYLIKWRAAKTNPVIGQFLYAEETARSRELPLPELLRWNQQCGRMLRVYSLLKLLLGLRNCDMLLLGDMNVDELRGVLRTAVSKGRGNQKKQMVFKLTWALRIVLRAAKALPRPKTQTLFFVSQRGPTRGLGLTQDGFGSAWERAQAKWVEAGNLPFWEHDIRSTAGDEAAGREDRGADRAAELLGHSNRNVTKKHYLRGVRTVRPLR